MSEQVYHYFQKFRTAAPLWMNWALCMLQGHQSKMCQYRPYINNNKYSWTYMTAWILTALWELWVDLVKNNIQQILACMYQLCSRCICHDKSHSYTPLLTYYKRDSTFIADSSFEMTIAYGVDEMFSPGLGGFSSKLTVEGYIQRGCPEAGTRQNAQVFLWFWIHSCRCCKFITIHQRDVVGGYRSHLETAFISSHHIAVSLKTVTARICRSRCNLSNTAAENHRIYRSAPQTLLPLDAKHNSPS